MKNIISFLFVSLFVFVACGGSPLMVHVTKDAPVATATDTQTATNTSSVTATQTNTMTSTVTTTSTATATSTVTDVFKIVSVDIYKADDSGNYREDTRTFGVIFSSRAKDIDLVISSKETGEYYQDHRDLDAGNYYYGPMRWIQLRSNTTYQWSLTASAMGPVFGNTFDAKYGEFTTALCFAGESRDCYSGPVGTENVGRCHGSTQACITTGASPQWDANCVGEVTPYPWGDFQTFGNYIDDDCDGTINEGQLSYCADSGVTLTCCASGGASFEKRIISQISPGQIVKGTSTQYTYLFAKDGRRYVFPNREAVNSWYMQYDSIGTADLIDFCRNIYELSDTDLASIPIGGNVTIRPGTYIVKIGSDPTLYVVARGRTLRMLATADLAEQIYPGTSVARTRVISEAFFTIYNLGPDVVSKDDYDPRLEWAESVPIETEIGSK